MNLPLRRFFLSSLMAAATAFTSPAHAWGAQSHQIIATLAQAQLNAPAKAEVDRLLAMEPGQTLQSISTWADENRNPATAAWHYVNFPRETCSYDAARDCRDGNCVVAAIEREAEILKGRGPDERRLLALKYLVHFVGDVHQPLHAGYADDRGGNSYQLQAFLRGTNLHAFWDSGLLRSLEETPETVIERIRKTRINASLATPAGMAEESCRVVALDGFYPGRQIDVDYVQRFAPVMEGRLALAGARLAKILNELR